MKEFGLIGLAIVHGFFAAWLAIWMLFYPREAKFIWGRKLPFTPGLIPSSRGAFEEVLAEAIASQILQPETLFESAKKQGITQTVRQALPQHLELLMNDEDFPTKISEGVASAIRDHLRSKRGLEQELDGSALVPYSKKSIFSLSRIMDRLWSSIDEGIDRVCGSQQFRDTVRQSVKRTATELDDDSSALSGKVDGLVEEIIGIGVHSLDLKALILERLLSLSNEEIENLVFMAAGKQLRSIKSVAAILGIFFGLLSVLIFG